MGFFSKIKSGGGGKSKQKDIPVAVPVQSEVVGYSQYPPVQEYPATPQQQQQLSTTPYTNMRNENNNNGPLALDDTLQYQMDTIVGDRSCIHKLFDGMSLIACFTAINNIVGQAVALWFEGNKPMEVVLRLYIIGLCTLAILVEMESTSFITNSAILMNWISRGLFYMFIGVLGENLYDIGYDNYNRRYNNNAARYASHYNSPYSNNYGSNNYYNSYVPRMPTGEDVAEWYVWGVAWVMVGVGGLYLVLGLLGFRQKYVREIANHEARTHKIKNHKNSSPV